MPPQRATKLDVQAYRFGLRRLEHAIATGSAFRDPLQPAPHGRALLIGALLTGLVLAGSAVYGMVNPVPDVGDEQVLVNKDTGGAFVVRDGVVHPAMNVASALLAAGVSEKGGQRPRVRKVNSASLEGWPKGPLIGIPGAPHAIPDRKHVVNNVFTACDDTNVDPGRAPGGSSGITTTLLVGERTEDVEGKDKLGLLVQSAEAKYLIAAGKRYKVSATSGDLSSFLAHQTSARDISKALLETIPEGAELKVPEALVKDRGAAPDFKVTGMKIGDVFKVESASQATKFYIVRRKGVQQIPPIVADLLKARDTSNVTSLADLGTMPLDSDRVDLSQFPQELNGGAVTEANNVLCVDWKPEANGSLVRVYATKDVPLPAGAKATPTLRKRADVDLADSVYIRPEHAYLACPAPAEWQTNCGTARLLTDAGKSYAIVNEQAMAALGLENMGRPARSQFLRMIPQGPALDPRAAGALYRPGS